MLDYKLLQYSSEDRNDSPYTPYEHKPRPTEPKATAIDTIKTFYNNKEQYEAFVRLVGEEEAKKWMKNLLRRDGK